MREAIRKIPREIQRKLAETMKDCIAAAKRGRDVVYTAAAAAAAASLCFYSTNLLFWTNSKAKARGWLIPTESLFMEGR